MRLRLGAALLVAWGLCLGARAAGVAVPDVAPPAAAACLPEPAPPTQAESLQGLRDAVDSGLLWKATKAGRAVYLYGTIHVAQRAWMYPGPHVLRAALDSDTFALELDMSEPAILARLKAAIERRPDAPDLPPALEARLRERMAAACIAPETLATLRPEMRAVTVEVMEGRQFGLYSAYGIDIFMAGLARGLKKPIRSLETPEAQARLLVSDDPAETAATVDQVLADLEGGKGPAMLQRLAGDWQRGDLDDLGAYASWCGCMDTRQQRADFVKLVDERNPAMADKIVQWHAEGRSLFVAVGTLHMIGRAGLPALLRERGFAVERVAFGDGR
ncbi:MAG: TraB/GumN family protein [Betaproteobacteria bacterium]